MCFAIPYRIKKIEKNTAVIEGGRKIKLERNFSAKKGDYLQVAGGIAVSKLSGTEGEKIRKLIKSLYEGQ
ncbi:hypothetical protein A2W14_03220 [Candidatus Gottesmanbacteria bacterium RBG_16_37_8]|uniref:HypC/HybG/HupF family hydrogenase formation chaperone n=1 Tax=Candidatus Gottesmanbacteria bacterium RBG_16_37_8 TaxID=1798371 RepID=A0A1F5YU04_9BACT|nr:MAG: hypothetical protein A2W14_03220 [Candidatus Gottesmanbacteria bacterium RBG_16_37_8]